MAGKKYHTEPDQPYLLVALFFAASVAVFLVNQHERFLVDMDAYGQHPAWANAETDRHTRVTIDFGNGTRRAFWGPVQNGMTAMLALRASQQAGKFAVETDAMGRIKGIAGVGAEDDRAWRLLINDMPVSDVSGNVEIQPGDRLLFRYE